jgi:hypothetical protein
MKKLKIQPELKNLLPPLTETERQGLENDILKHGCLAPIATWEDVIVDGHARYEICEKYSLPFETHEIRFHSLDEAMLWAWQHQEGRRNLTPYQRAELALKFKPEIAAKAKVNQGNRQEKVLTPIDTKHELSKVAGVSHGTMYKAEYLHNYADDETKQKLRDGETTINREYTRLKEATQPMLPQPLPVPKRRLNSSFITPENAKELIECIADRFGVKELEQFIFDLIARLQKIKSKPSFKVFLKKLFEKYLH